MVASPRTQGEPVVAAAEGLGEMVAATGFSGTPLTNALEVAVPVWAGPPDGSGQLARIHTLEVSPATTLSGLSWTVMCGLVAVGVAVGLAVVIAVFDVVGVGVGESVGTASAEAAQPVNPTMTMAPAYATRLTLSTAAPHFAVLHPSIHPKSGCRPS
jgi:hypothetical protein